MQAGARVGVQGAVRGAGQTGQRAEAAAGQAGLWAGQAGWDGSWFHKVSHCVVERLGAHREACWTFFHTALLKEVVACIALNAYLPQIQRLAAVIARLRLFRGAGSC